MKKKILQKLLLIGTVAWFTTPFLVAPCGQRHEEKAEIIEEIVITTEHEINNWVQGWTTGVVNAKEEPYIESKIAKVYMEYESINFYFYDSMWCAVKLEDKVVYINKDYITTNKTEIEYRQLMDKRTVTEEWFFEYKEFINKHISEDLPETIYDCFTENELDLLFRVVQAEIGDYNFEQKVNVANVIFNRIYSEEFGDTIQDVLVANQFCTIANGRISRVEVDKSTILACEYAFSFPDTTNGALFFDSNGALEYQFLFSDGAHNFYTVKD